MSVNQTVIQPIIDALTNITIPVTKEQIPIIVVDILSVMMKMPTVVNLSAADKTALVTSVVQYYISKSNLSPELQAEIIQMIPSLVVIEEEAPTAWNWFIGLFKNCSCASCCTCQPCVCGSCKPCC